MSSYSPEEDEDWQINKSLVDCTTQLHQSHHLSDVTFVFPQEHPRTSVPAHKLILAIRSPVFERMFFGALPAKDTVNIEDNSSAAFKALLRFIYTDRLDFDTSSEAMETMQAAHKYRIPLLADICVSFLQDYIDTERVCSFLDQACLFELKALQSSCLKFIDQNTNHVFNSEGFMMLTVAALECILKSNDLKLDECEIYQAAVSWAAAECNRKQLHSTGENKRKVLGQAFYHLRLPHIPLETFSKVVSRDGLLTNEEIIDLFRFHTAEPKEKLKFVNCERRNFPSGMVVTRMADGVSSSNMQKGWRSETIKFQVNLSDPKLQGQKARLVGLGLMNVRIKKGMDDNCFGNSHLLGLSIELEDPQQAVDSDSDDDDYYQRPSMTPRYMGVSSVCLHFTSKETDVVSVDLPKPIDLTDCRWYKLDVTLYSFNKTVLNGKNYHLLGSPSKTRVIMSSGLIVSFQGTTHGPIHSLYIRT